MTYSIGEVAKKTGLTAHTLRYYDKEGLMPYVDRDSSGNRLFKDSDFEWLKTIKCLKDTGMPIKKIKDFVHSCMTGDETINHRLETLTQHKKDVLAQMAELEKNLETIDYKIWYYETAKEAGTTKIHDK